jgi:hypothetical protein
LFFILSGGGAVHGLKPVRPMGVFMHNEGQHIVETAVEARAGFLDRRTLVVLIVSTCLTIFAMIFIGFFVR